MSIESRLDSIDRKLRVTTWMVAIALALTVAVFYLAGCSSQPAYCP